MYHVKKKKKRRIQLFQKFVACWLVLICIPNDCLFTNRDSLKPWRIIDESFTG